MKKKKHAEISGLPCMTNMQNVLGFYTEENSVWYIIVCMKNMQKIYGLSCMTNMQDVLGF